MHKAYEWASEITLSWHMETFALSMDEACAFLGISRPACQQWIRTGRLMATRKDPSKPKSPYLLTRQACIAALNNPMHTVAVSAADAHEENKSCRSSAEVPSWYGSYTTPGGKHIKESPGTEDRKQAQELHDRRKAEL